LEKLSTATGQAIFATNGEALAGWPVRALFVVPPLLVYRPEWDQAERHITDTVFLRPWQFLKRQTEFQL